MCHSRLALRGEVGGWTGRHPVRLPVGADRGAPLAPLEWRHVAQLGPEGRLPPRERGCLVSGTTVLVVEDDDAVREIVAYHLAAAGFQVREAATATQGWDESAGASLIVLDWMLPDESGLSLLRRLRTSSGAKLPVLMLTARAREAERVEGLEAGADDYLTKPFSAAELVARVRALLRRVEPPKRIAIGPLVVDVDAGEASWHGEKRDLTRREFELVCFLAANPGRVYSRFELLDKVWGEDFAGTERTVDQHVAQLRAAIADELVVTVRGRGYRLGDLRES